MQNLLQTQIWSYLVTGQLVLARGQSSWIFSKVLKNKNKQSWLTHELGFGWHVPVKVFCGSPKSWGCSILKEWGCCDLVVKKTGFVNPTVEAQIFCKTCNFALILRVRSSSLLNWKSDIPLSKLKSLTYCCQNTLNSLTYCCQYSIVWHTAVTVSGISLPNVSFSLSLD